LRRRGGGIKAAVLRKARITVLPSIEGSCEFFRCVRDGRIRYFVAAKLPWPIHMCDEHYRRVRDALEEALEDILDEVRKIVIV